MQEIAWLWFKQICNFVGGQADLKTVRFLCRWLWLALTQAASSAEARCQANSTCQGCTCVCVCVCVCVHTKLCLTLSNPSDCSPPGSSIHGILQARRLEWIAMPSSRGSSPPRDRTRVSCNSCFGRRVLHPAEPSGKPFTLDMLTLKLSLVIS